MRNTTNNSEEDLVKITLSTDYSKFDYSRFEYNQNVYGQYEWVEYFNAKDNESFYSKNSFPDYVLELKDANPLHSSILSIKNNLVKGQGLHTGKGYIDKIVNKYGETLNDVFDKVTSDFHDFNGYYLKIVWSRDGKSIADLQHVDFSKMRSGKWNKKGEIDTYYYCQDWKNGARILDNIVKFPAFDINNRVGEQILFRKKYQSGKSIYPVPTYVSAFHYLELSNQLAKHFLNITKNQFTPSFAISHPTAGQATNKIKNETVEDFRKFFQGSNGAGVIHLFFDGNGEAPKIKPLAGPDNEKKYRELLDQIDSEIIAAHSFPPALLQQIAGKLGGSDDVQYAYKQLQANVVVPNQQFILKDFNMLGQFLKLKNIYVLQAEPVQIYKDEVLLSALSVDEVRDLLGYTGLEAGVKTVKQELLEKNSQAFGQDITKNNEVTNEQDTTDQSNTGEGNINNQQ